MSDKTRNKMTEADFWLRGRGTPTGCHEWIGARSGRDGYGVCVFRGKTYRAHRLAYEITNGPIPPGMRVCHHCDNPPCYNPRHLFLGTSSDNKVDSVKKGRHYGKLYYCDALEIRRLRAVGTSQKELAAQFSVSQSMISQILSGKRWAL